MKIALITGVTGQDGSYLVEFLLKKGYEVHGIKRRASLINTDRIDHLYRDRHESNVRFFLHHGDLTDSSSLIRIIQQTQPDEIYVEMQWVMLQQDQPEDYVIVTGIQYSVRDFVNAAAVELGMNITWERQGVDEVGFLNSRAVVRVDPRYFRATEVETLLSYPSKVRDKLGWPLRQALRNWSRRWCGKTSSPESETSWSRSMSLPHSTATNDPTTLRAG